MGSYLKCVLVYKFVVEKDVESHLISLLPLLFLLGWQLYQKMEHGKFGTLMVSNLHCSDFVCG